MKTKRKPKLHRITLEVGDWSRDGHEKTEDIDIQCNLSLKELKDAYKKGTKKLGFDFIETVAAEYEDSRLPADKWQKLTKLGLKLDYELEMYDLDDESEGYCLEYETYTDIVMFICSIGNPKMVFKFIEEPPSDSWAIGGYGLFY